MDAPAPLYAFPDLTSSGNLRLIVGTRKSEPVGHVPPKVTEQLLSPYQRMGGFDCDLSIGNDYSIKMISDQLTCSVILTITPD